MQNRKKKRVQDVPESRDRRKVVGKIVAGAGVLAGYSVLPARWTTPIVGQMVLPAHAQTSGITLAATNTTEVYSLRSFAGNDKRFTWLNETGARYGGQVRFVFSNGWCKSTKGNDR